MKNPLSKYVEKILMNPKVMICVASGLEYTLKTNDDKDGFPTSITFKTKNPVRFRTDKTGNIIVEEKKI